MGIEPVDIYRVVRVHWNDTATYSGWTSLDEIKAIVEDKPVMIETVGWLIHQDEDQILVASSVSKFKASEIIRIPSSCIVDMWVDRSNALGDHEVHKENPDLKDLSS